MIPIDLIASAALEATATTLFSQATSSLLSKIPSRLLRKKIAGAKIILNKGLPEYLQANYAKCETLKTLLSRNDPVLIEECFVSPRFKSEDKICSSEQLLDQVYSESRKIIVTGLAGSGKSVFLKHTFRRVLERGDTYFPIFFELRQVNGYDSAGPILLPAILKSIQQSCPSFSTEQLQAGMDQGAFYFILDGYDELTQGIRDRVAEEICALASNFYKCAVVMTSRPLDDFVGWEGFFEAKLQPFDLEQVADYIEKVKFDNEKKQDFLEELRKGLFEKNQDFLSNPLLAAMMLLTYDSFGEIPARRHIFYEKCFDVLSREHDASKGRFKRQLLSGLSIDQLEQAFMFFCAFSYSDRIISFNAKQMRDYVQRALSACATEDSAPNVIRDFRESISIIELDGQSYEFAHRSFQEYFYAKFAVTDRRLSLKQKVEWLVESFTFDDTVDMIAEMNREYFEDEYLLPAIKIINRKISGLNAVENPAGVLRPFFAEAKLFPGSRDNHRLDSIGWHISKGNAYYILRHSLRTYGHAVASVRSAQSSMHSRDPSRTAVLRETYGGGIKTDSRNNAKLIAIGLHEYALDLQKAMKDMVDHLNERQGIRKASIGNLLKARYET